MNEQMFDIIPCFYDESKQNKTHTEAIDDKMRERERQKKRLLRR